MRQLFHSITRRPSVVRIIAQFFLISLIIFTAACKEKTGTDQTVDITDKAQTNIHRLDTMLLSTPNTVEINPDSLIRKPVKGRRVKAGEPKVIEYKGVQTVKTGPPKITRLPDNLKRVLPGSDSIPALETFKLWKPGLDTSGQIIPAFNIRTVNVTHPVPVPALAPRFRDNATCDIRYLDLDQGMNSSYIWSVIEDSRGIIWMGTARGGLSRYNGSQFIHYTPAEGLNDDIIRSVTEDVNGNIWFGTYKGGIGKFNGSLFTYYAGQEGFSDNQVNTILADSKGNIWAGFWSDGVYKIEHDAAGNSSYEVITHYTEKEGLVSNWLTSMMEDSNGNIWFGTRDGLCRFNGKSFVHITENEGLTHNTIVSLLQDKKGDIWIGTRAGLNKLSFQTDNHTEMISLAKYTEKEGLVSTNIVSIVEDTKGDLWLGTYGGGVISYDGANFTTYDEQAGLSNNYVQDMVLDQYDNLWIGTAGGGINKLNPHSFYHIIDKEVNSILEDREGNIWLATRHDGILKFDGKSFLQYTAEEGLSNDRVYPLLEDRYGNIWAGTWFNGVNKFDGEYFTHYTENEGLSINSILSLAEDEEGNILIGTNGGGLVIYDGTHITNITDQNGFYCNWDGTIISEGSGNHWFCGPGINWSDGNYVRRYTMLEKLVNLEIWSGFEDRFNNIWFSTIGEGVVIFSPDAKPGDGSGSFDYLTEQNGLLSNTVWSVAEDPHGNIWVSTEKGLNLLSPVTAEEAKASGRSVVSKDFQNYKISSFLREDGLKSLTFCANSSYSDSKNRMWWGTTKALSMLDVNSYKLPTKPPRLSLNSIDIGQEFIDFRDLQESRSPGIKTHAGLLFSQVADFGNYPLDLELPFGKNQLTFYYTAIDWAAPHKLSYQYMLEGFDREWSQITGEDKAVYRKIPPGSYTFKARAIGSANIWSDTVEYSFIVHPPWYRSIVAYLIYSLMLLAVLYGFMRWRTWRIRKERDELELQVRDRTQEIEQQKDEIEQQNEELQITLENLRETQVQLIQSEKLAALGGLVAGVAHEINTPVGISVTAASSLVEETDRMADHYKHNRISRAEFKDYLNTASQSAKLILSNMERTATMVQSFKQVSVDQSTEQQRKFKLREYSQDVIRSLYPRLKGKRVKINLDIDDQLEMYSYPGAFSQILTNLIINSLVHGFDKSDKGNINISARQADEELFLEYKDDGKGIPKQNLEKIFDPFFTTNKKIGTGLGLHIVYNIVNQKLMGSITCSSENEKGVSFMMKIPVYK